MRTAIRPHVVTAEFNAQPSFWPKAPSLPPDWRLTPVGRIAPVPQAKPPAEVVVDITELVRSNRLFTQLAAALRLTDEQAREYLRAAMQAAGTHAGAITAEELWFMVPRIESDVISRFVHQDASVRRVQLGELLRRLRFEGQNRGRTAVRDKEKGKERLLFALPHARLA